MEGDITSQDRVGLERKMNLLSVKELLDSVVPGVRKCVELRKKFKSKVLV